MRNLTTRLDHVLAGTAGRRRVLARAGTISLGAVLGWFGLSEAALTGRGGRAYAAPGDVLFTCTGIATSFFNPGLTTTFQNNINVEVTGSFVDCLPPGSGVPGATIDFVGHMDASCSQVTDYFGTGHIRYGAGSALTTSTWGVDDFTIIRQVGQAVGVISGTITNGAFTGALARTFFIRADKGACTSPIIAQGGTNTLVVSEQ